MPVKHRSPILVIVLSLITFGLYALYWWYQTKNEMNSLGASIPTFILAIIPIVNFYWMWKYCEAYAKYVKKDDSAALLTFLAFLIFFPIGQYLVQVDLNKIAGKGNVDVSKLAGKVK